MTSKNDICVVCAWRETCQKKYTLSGRDLRCPDFVRDMLFQERKREEEQEKQKKDDM